MVGTHAMTRAELLDFLRKYKLCVEATVTSEGAPQAAVVGYEVSDELEIVFDTLAANGCYRTRLGRRQSVLGIVRLTFVYGGNDTGRRDRTWIAVGCGVVRPIDGQGVVYRATVTLHIWF